MSPSPFNRRTFLKASAAIGIASARSDGAPLGTIPIKDEPSTEHMRRTRFTVHDGLIQGRFNVKAEMAVNGFYDDEIVLLTGTDYDRFDKNPVVMNLNQALQHSVIGEVSSMTIVNTDDRQEMIFSIRFVPHAIEQIKAGNCDLGYSYRSLEASRPTTKEFRKYGKRGTKPRLIHRRWELICLELFPIQSRGMV